MIISRQRASRKLCLHACMPRLGFEPATFELLDIPTELHGQEGLKTGNYELYILNVINILIYINSASNNTIVLQLLYNSLNAMQ